VEGVVVVVVVVGEAGGRTAQKCTALLGHETKTTHAYMELLFGIYGRCFLAVGDILWAYIFIITIIIIIVTIVIIIIITIIVIIIIIEN